MDEDGKLCPLEIKKNATPDKRIIRTFGVIDKAPPQVGTEPSSAWWSSSARLIGKI
ncbi:MAG: hypothetical protein IJZ80_02880 [Clostridia bacterium]|nr:hypothetical protein [Clostridia bacterium]